MFNCNAVRDLHAKRIKDKSGLSNRVRHEVCELGGLPHARQVAQPRHYPVRL